MRRVAGTPTDELLLAGSGVLDAVAALCARSLPDPPMVSELASTLLHPDQPVVARGDPTVGVVVTCSGVPGVSPPDAGFVRLLVVDPAARRQGHGIALLAAGETDLRDRGAASVTVGADAPFFLWPGAPATGTALLCLLERQRYERGEANLNMDVDLDAVPADAGGWEAPGPAGREEVQAWARRHWVNWAPELAKAADQDGLTVARDADGEIVAACAHDVNRRGLLGPVAVRPDLIGRGLGVAPLLGALHRMRAAGQRRAEVTWVGPLRPYARIGATLGRVFLVYRKTLR